MKHKVKVISGTKTSLPFHHEEQKATVAGKCPARQQEAQQGLRLGWSYQLRRQNTPALLKMSLIEKVKYVSFHNVGNNLKKNGLVTSTRQLSAR